MSDQQWLLAEHQRRNQTTVKAHGLFTPHRQRVMELLKQTADRTAPGRICVLGAGNCNDLDLVELLEIFEEAVLVDVDQAATESAVAGLVDDSLRDRLRIASSTDVTGIFARLQVADVKDCNSGAVQELLQLLAVNPPVPFAPYDFIVSTCLLSQLIDSVGLALGTNHSSIVPVILALRRQHIRALVEAIVPGGLGVVVFDFVSSNTLPNLMQIHESHLMQAIVEAINAKNFFTGLNPFAIRAELQTDPAFAERIADVRLHPPWRWDIGPKQFAVAAISFRRS